MLQRPEMSGDFEEPETGMRLVRPVRLPARMPGPARVGLRTQTRRRPLAALLVLGCLMNAGPGPARGAESRPAGGVDPAAHSAEHSAEDPPLRAWHWRRVAVPSGGPGLGLTAVAAQSGGFNRDSFGGTGDSGARVAIGDLGGVSLREGNGAFRFAARAPGVTDLRFDSEGALWIASTRGLWHLSPQGRLSERSPAPGELARAVRRVAVAADLVCVGTDAGAWISSDGVRWQRLVDGLPSGPVPALGIRAADPTFPGSVHELWLVAAGSVWRLSARSEPLGVWLGPAEKVRIPGTPVGVSAVDVVTQLPGVRVAVVYPRLIAFARSAASGRAPLAPVSFASWEIVRPALPPGARTRRLTAAAGGAWLATDLGLLTARELAGPWRRASGPAGSAPIWSLAASPAGDALLAVGEQGLFSGTPIFRASVEPTDRATQTRGAVAPRRSSAAATADPDIRAVQRAGLRYTGLGPERFADLRKGLARRGWLPTLSLRLAGGHDRQRQRDYDEAFLSGETRHLYDTEKERSLALDASVVLTWDFGDVAFNPEAIDVSREARLVISLRDSVLDEINQLYFERRGLLQRLAESPSAGGPDARQLVLRAAELAAGLDAWTGGWFSEVHAARSGPSSENAPQ